MAFENNMKKHSKESCMDFPTRLRACRTEYSPHMYEIKESKMFTWNGMNYVKYRGEKVRNVETKMQLD